MSSSAIVFLPGLLCDARLWRDQAAGLSGIGNSFIADLTLDDSIASMAQRVLAQAPDRFALAALSMGGYVAFEILRQAPQRVTRLALLDTSAATDDESRTRQRQAAIDSLKVGRFAGVTNRLLPRLIHASHVDGPLGEDLKAMAARVGSEAFLRQQRAILGRPDSRPLLPTISVPTLVAVGDADVLTPPSDSLVIHDGIVNSTFHLFTDCGHLPALEKAQETTELLRQWMLW